ncbi:MAG: type II toxin-antitoxin system VapC family toxin [Candidatus Wildermuthbacteria bacterium]|nr:type II toxin-antitoxin system VapC family toxin [Candidatus Wildermuthbacteria bacterium]
MKFSMVNLVDSSLWVALFLDFDTQHEKAKKLFSKINGKMHVPYCVVNEVVTVLAYKHSKEQANQFISFIEENQDVKFLDDNLQEEMAFYTSLSSRISFTDAALLLLSKKAKAKIITFDKQLVRLARR